MSYQAAKPIDKADELNKGRIAPSKVWKADHTACMDTHIVHRSVATAPAKSPSGQSRAVMRRRMHVWWSLEQMIQLCRKQT